MLEEGLVWFGFGIMRNYFKSFLMELIFLLILEFRFKDF